MASEEGACRKHIHGSFPRSSRSISSSGSNGVRRRGKWRARLGWRASYFMIGLRPIGRAAPPGSIASAGARWGGERPPALPAPSEPASADAGPSPAGSADEFVKATARIAELERIIGRQQADLHFFREALRLWDATSRSAGAPASTRSSQEMTAELQGFCEKDADVQRLCGLGGVSRAGYYRRLAPKAARRDDADLRDLIQRIALDNRHYGIAASPMSSGVRASWSTRSGCCA